MSDSSSQTIREMIEPKLEQGAKARLASLEQNNAPASIVKAQVSAIANGDFSSKVGHIKDFGDCTVSGTENRKYRRGYGVRFTLTDGRQVDMIPGPYGLFLALVD